MSRRNMYLLGMLLLLLLANVGMLMGLTNWPQSVRENFASDFVAGKTHAAPVKPVKSAKAAHSVPVKEGFMDTLVTGTFGTAPIGTYDGVNMAANLPPAAQGFRARLPNEPLAGPPVEIGPDHLFYFANNQCKPECCGATLSCDGGCVCTTPEQRNFINTRGGNRTRDDGF